MASVPSSRNNAVVANNKVPLSMPRTKPVSNLCRKVSQNHLSTQSFIRSRHVGGTKPSFSKHASATPPRSNAFSNKPLPKRVPPTQPVPQQHVDDGKSNNVSPCLKRKRPRCDVGAASEVVPPASHVDYGPAAPASFNSNIDLMSIAVDVGAFDTVPDRMATPCMYRSKPVVTGPKKRKCASTPSSGSNIVATGSLPGSCMGFDDLVVVSPGSPVSSDGDMSEETLGLNVFSCDILPPLIPRDGDALELGGDDVGAIINVVDEAELFGYGSPCGALNSLDTRFGPFDLDNIQSFCLNKVEGL